MNGLPVSGLNLGEDFSRALLDRKDRGKDAVPADI